MLQVKALENDILILTSHCSYPLLHYAFPNFPCYFQAKEEVHQKDASHYQRSNEGALLKITASYMEFFQTSCSVFWTGS